MTTLTIKSVLVRKQWMTLAMPEDVEQTVWLAIALHPNETEHHQALELLYQLALLERFQWNRIPRKRPRRPHLLSPAKAERASGYLSDPERKRRARMKVSPERRKEIAIAANRARRKK